MRAPVLWLATAYGAGLALFAGVETSPRLLLALATIVLLAGALTLHRRGLRTALACALAGFFLAGGATLGLDDAAVAPTRVDRLVAGGQLDLSEAVRLTGWLRAAPVHRPFATSYELDLESIETGGRTLPASGGVRLAYFPEPGAPAPLPALQYGDRVEILARVHLPVNHQNLGSFDWRNYLARRGLYLEGSIKGPELVRVFPGRRGHAFFRWIQDLRAHLLARLDALVPPDTQPDRNAVLRAMLLGDRGFLSHRLADSFRLSGAYHVLVISGLHVAVIALFLFWLLRRLRLPELPVTLLTVALLVFYLLLVQDRPPIERAVWMVSLYLGARLLYRRVRLANPLALAALLVLFLHPRWLFSPGFQLSFAAVGMIAFFAVPWIERSSQPVREALRYLDTPERDAQTASPRLQQLRLDLRATADLLAGHLFWVREKERAARRLLLGGVRFSLRLWDYFLISVAVYLALMLLTPFYFNRVVWIGLLTNIVVVPLVGAIVPLGLAALLVGLVWVSAGTLLATLTGWLISLLLWLVGWLSSARLSYGIPPPPLWLVTLYVAALIALAVAIERQRWERWVGAALAVLILLVVSYPFPPRLGKGLEVTVLDVGQGDSLFVAFPSHETWLIDGGSGPVAAPDGYLIGEDIGRTVVVPYLRARGLKRLDRVWLTHAHHDHMTGLFPVLTELHAGSLNVGRNPESAAYHALLDDARARGIPVRQHHAGERFWVGGLRVDVLWPPDNRAGSEPSNDNSIVLRLCRETCMLLPGDIEPDVEKELAASSLPLTAAFLKVPHHGGRGAASEEFLAAVHPRVAAISVGATNPFGHPFPEVEARLAAAGARTYRTDRDGSVTARLANGTLRVQSFRGSHPSRPYPNLWSKLVACTRALLSLQSN